MRRRRFLSAFVVFASVWRTLQASPAPRIWLVQSEAGGIYAETAAVVRLELPMAAVRDGLAATVLDAREPPPALILTIGAVALEETLRWLRQQPSAAWQRVPVLATLLPRSSFLSAQSLSDGRPLSAVWLDQPWSRQFAILRRLLPERTRVGILPGPETRAVLPQIEAEARAAGLRLVVGPAIDTPEQIYHSLREVLVDADVLLAVPDALVYNAATLRNILLTSYRARVPMAAFSAAYVKAGALYAVHSTPAQIARQSAQIMRAYLAGHPLPPPQAPREFTLVANARVAASLGIVLDDIDRIAEERRAAER
ncbi:MAG: hypothetical protein N2441_08140, partial [Rhodocyclaceae bacterium]|nr:hypothetical protein [Rhodocyclaceae bacterium]